MYLILQSSGSVGTTWRIGIWSNSENGFVASTDVTQSSSTTNFNLNWNFSWQGFGDDWRLVIQSVSGTTPTIIISGNPTILYGNVLDGTWTCSSNISIVGVGDYVVTRHASQYRVEWTVP